jgi:hypothetical protein
MQFLSYKVGWPIRVSPMRLSDPTRLKKKKKTRSLSGLTQKPNPFIVAHPELKTFELLWGLELGFQV